MKKTDAGRAAVIIAVHKAYRMPEDPLYLPLHVGACRQDITDLPPEVLKERWDADFQKDDTGQNISYLNPSFCELTGLYWAWKNLEADYLGLVHYRRHFSIEKKADPFESILSMEQLSPYLDRKKVFVPKKRNYYIETLYSHYAHTHFAVQLDCARQILAEKYPDYVPVYDEVVKRTSGYMFNMMILKKDLFDSYCAWLFDVLFEMKTQLGARTCGEVPADAEEILKEKTPQDTPVLSDFQSRFYGRVSEIIFNVWLEYQLKKQVIRKEEIMELGYLNLEGENWGKKISAFLKAKFAGRKYEQSF